MNNRVVITGLGLCTPLGNELTEFWDNLLAGRSGISEVSHFDVSAFPVRIGGQVKALDRNSIKAAFPGVADETDRKIWFGLDAVQSAINDAEIPGELLKTSGLLIGVSLESFSLEALEAIGKHPRCMNDLLKPKMSMQTPLDKTTRILGDRYGFSGGRIVNCSACAAGAQAIGEAYRRLRSGLAEVFLAGATDSVLNPLGLGGFGLLRILSTENESPETACRPFDVTRQGTVLGEGAAFLVLETLSHALDRKARIYAEIAGYGTSLDAYRITDPDPLGKGAVRSMKRALADAGLRAEAVDGINAHGTGTPKNDLSETLAIKEIFGARARGIPVSANKSMTGHLIAASGAVEAVASVMTLHACWIPPTINLKNPDPECDLDYVPEGKRPFMGDILLSNSFGFGGQNATLIFKRYYA